MDVSKYKKVLVTGAAGFMGSHLVDWLVEKDLEVYGVDDLSGGYMRNVNEKSKFVELDLRDKEATKKLIEEIKPELIFHLAADATEGRSQFTPINCTERTYLGFLNLIAPAINNNLKRVVVASSMSVYGDQQAPFHEDLEPKPEDIYAIAKAAKEKSVQILSSVHDFEYVIVRPHNVYGEKQNIADPYRNVVGIFINSLLQKKNFFIYGDGEQKRSFTYIEDCVLPLVKCGFMDNMNGEIINIGPGPDTAITINELAQVVLEEFFESKDIPEEFKPVYLEDRPKEVKYAFCTYDKAQKLLGYEPKTELRTGIRKMIQWARDLGPQKPVYLDSFEIESDKTPKTWKEKLI